MALLELVRMQETIHIARDADHIVCGCRPQVAFCGVVDDTPIVEAEPDGSECAGCYRIWSSGVCPGCGCRKHEVCGQCGEAA